MQGFRRQNNKFINDIDEESIITLFNFDQTISNILISNILNIERKFNTAFCYIIGQEMHKNKIINCEILKNIHLIFDEKNMKVLIKFLIKYQKDLKTIYFLKNMKKILNQYQYDHLEFT